MSVKWSQYIPHTPTPKQLEALTQDDEFEILYGGALGGGKSDYLLMCGLQYADIPGYASVIFRKSLTDLKLPGALLDRAREWLGPWLKNRENPTGPVRWEAAEHTYYFNTFYPDGSPGAPSKLVFGYIGESDIRMRYQSAEFQTVCFDEISQWDTHDDYLFLTTRLRKTVCKKHGKNLDGTPNYVDGCLECDVKKIAPIRLRAATNPGGRGGLWLKKRFGIIPDPALYPNRRDALRAIKQGIRVPFVGTSPDRKFIPSFLEDNPYLDQVTYRKTLEGLDEHEKSQLLDGNWEARQDARFDRLDAQYFNLFEGKCEIGMTMFPFSKFRRIFMTCDPAGTSMEGVIDAEVNRKKARSYTVICVWGITKDNKLMLLHMKRFRSEIPEIVEEIGKIYGKFNRYNVRYVKMECNGVGLGAAQYVIGLGIPVKKVFKGKDKLENSTAAQLLVKAKRLYLPDNAPFITEFEDEVFSWTGHPNEQDDIVDNLSDAAEELGPNLDMLEGQTSRSLKKRLVRPRTGQLVVPTVSPASPLYRNITGIGRGKKPDSIRREAW